MNYDQFMLERERVRKERDALQYAAAPHVLSFVETWLGERSEVDPLTGQPVFQLVQKQTRRLSGFDQDVEIPTSLVIRAFTGVTLSVEFPVDAAVIKISATDANGKADRSLDYTACEVTQISSQTSRIVLSYALKSNVRQPDELAHIFLKFESSVYASTTRTQVRVV